MNKHYFIAEITRLLQRQFKPNSEGKQKIKLIQFNKLNTLELFVLLTAIRKALGVN